MNGLADTERDELERHVESCPDCQQTLEELTDATMWDHEPRLRAVIARGDTAASLVVDPPRVTACMTGGSNERWVEAPPA